MPADASPDLSVVIPAFNEEQTLQSVLDDHRRVLRELGLSFEIVVCDDGSTDDTPAILASSAALGEARVLTHARNLGIALSLCDLYQAARGEWIFFNAADGQVPASQLRPLWEARHGYSLVTGWRRQRRDPAHRVVMARAYAAAIRLCFGVAAHDIDSVRLYRTDHLRDAMPHARSSFADAEILIRLVKQGRHVTERVVEHHPRRSGVPKGGSWRIVSRALWDFAVAVITMRLER